MSTESTLALAQDPSLTQVQRYVALMEQERGFALTSSNIQTALQLGEEIGELFKAIRKAEKMRLDRASTVTDVAEELADVLIFIAALANRYGVDLTKALHEKEAVNKTRSWTSVADSK